MIDLFLFEVVEKKSKIIIYGLGFMGQSYIDQIETSKWCEIVGVSDQKVIESSYKYILPCELGRQKDYDYIVIAIESLEIATQVYHNMLLQGVAATKIVNLNMRYGGFPSQGTLLLSNDKLQIVITEYGGFGDALMDMVFVKRLRKLVGNQSEILFACRMPDYFRRFSFLDYVIKCPNNDWDMKALREKSDITLRMHSIALVEKVNAERVKAVSELLHRYCMDCIYMQRNLFVNSENNFRYTKYGLLLGRNRIEHPDLHDILGLSRYDELEIPMCETSEYSNEVTNLIGKKYITVNRDTGSPSDVHPKIWPLNYYAVLLQMIKATYSDVIIIMVGKQQKELSAYVDVDLTEKTSLEDMNLLLKNAMLHIGGEGGMVHLMHFLGGKSMVFFGPTDHKVFGYPENINLYSDVCDERCAWITDEWTERCLKGDLEPECMKAILPEKAFEAFKEYIDSVYL